MDTPSLNFAFAQANFGLLRLSSEIRSPELTTFPPFTMGFSAAAFFQDTFTISAPGLQFQSGFVTVAYRLDGSAASRATSIRSSRRRRGLSATCLGST